MSEDVLGECNSRMFVGEPFGDDTPAYRCSFPEGHEGLHSVSFERSQWGPPPWNSQGVSPRRCGKVVVTWEFDERFPCPHHGLQNDPECQICMLERSSWSWDHECERCYGDGKQTENPELSCPVCEGTGYDPAKNPPEVIEESKRTGITAMDYENKTWA